MTGVSAAALIRIKRMGGRLTAAQWQVLARGIADETWSEGQIGALAMAVAWRGLEVDECRDATFALRDSGRCLRWDHLPGPVLDKHSTGGVGDCVSLALAPLLAACGAYVPMISGRGLGHTGGTLDKLESLPGYDVNPDTARLMQVVRDVGCAIVGQSPDLVPADRRLYAVRDVTATVDVPDLIVASILSKKLAGGAQALVLDIKTGSGAQTPMEPDAEALAQRMQSVAAGSALQLATMLSDMGQVLGGTAGNALEVRGVLDLLAGRAHCPRLRALVLAQAARLLLLGGLAQDDAEAQQRAKAALTSGAAAERFARMVAGLGGPRDVFAQALPQAPVQHPVFADTDGGIVQAIDVRALGEAVVALGGGRRVAGAPIDPAVGLVAVAERGQQVGRGLPLAIVHAQNANDAARAAMQVRAAFTVGEAAPASVLPWRWLHEAGN